MTIEKYEQILKTLGKLTDGTKFYGHVYSVGGCERSRILGLPIKDLDLVVDIPNGGIDLATWLHDNGHTCGGIVVYEKFGTAMFRLKDFPDEEIEVVHTRKECYRDDTSRKPETTFGTIMEDCKRRDFTMNAIYRSVATGQVFDLTEMGMSDIENKLIRSCDSPNIIFKEDPLRQFRAVRFCCQLGFDIEYLTLKGIQNNAKRIEIVSKERIKSEFDKILESNHPLIGLDLLNDNHLIMFGIPNLQQILNNNQVLPFIRDCVKAMENDPLTRKDRVLRKNILLAAMSMFQKQLKVKPFMDDLKYSNNEKDIVMDMVRAFYEYKEYVDNGHDMSKLRKMQLNLKLISYDEALSVVSSLGLIVTNKEQKNRDMVNYKLPINGDDIMRVTGLKPCKDVGVYIDNLTNLVLHAPNLTKEEMLEIVSSEHRQRIRNGRYGKLPEILDKLGFSELSIKTIRQKQN